MSQVADSARQGSLEDVRGALRGGSDPNMVDSEGFTAIHWACRRGQVETVQCLVEAGADINSLDSHAFTPLHWAASKGDSEVARLLISKGARLDEKDEYDFTPLHWAANKGHNGIAKVLLEANAAVDLQDSNGQTPMHWAAREGNYHVARVLVKFSTNLSSVDHYGVSPLHCAAYKGHEKVTQLLVAKSAPVNLRNNKGAIPLHSACSEGYGRIAGFLIRHGADCDMQDSSGMTPLHVAARAGHWRVAFTLSSKGANPTIANKDGETPLHVSVRYGNDRVTRELLNDGAEPNGLNNDGNSPLHLAAELGQLACAQLLVGAGAAPTIANNAGRTPLHVAVRRGRDQVAQYLVEGAGAHPGTLSSSGKTAFDLATNDALVRSLRDVASKAGLPAAAPAATPPSGIAPLLGRNATHRGDAAIRRVQLNNRRAESSGSQPPNGEGAPPASISRVDGGSAAASGAPAAPGAGAGAVAPVPSAPGEIATSASGSRKSAASMMHADWEIEFEELEMGALIGKGGYGEVFRGSWNGTEVAVKKLLVQRMAEKHMKEFEMEIAILNMLRHPNIVLFMGACTTPPHLCIVTEFCARGSLFHVLRDRNLKYDWHLMVKMASDIAKGMSYLHSRRPAIIHRDLKSLNVLVDENMNAKVCDFGLTKVKERAYMLTRVGTPQWMAPEVLRSAEYNEKADVFSYGCVLWELYTRQDPYRGIPAMEVGRRVVEGLRLPLPPSTPPVLAQMITACWAENPADRPEFKSIIATLRTF